MSLYLLDTNIVSYFLKQSNAHLNAKVRQTPAPDMYLSAITEAELSYGAEKLPKEAKLRSLVAATVNDFQVLPWDSSCARRYATLAVAQERNGLGLSQLDTMIAAHALALNLTLVTHDKAFTRIPGLAVEDWTEGPQRDSQPA